MINLKSDKAENLIENNWKVRKKSKDRKLKKMSLLLQGEGLKRQDNRLVENLQKKKIELQKPLKAILKNSNYPQNK